MRGWMVWFVVLFAAFPALASAQLSRRFRQHEYDRWAIRSSDGHWAFHSDPVVSGDDDSSSCRLVHDGQDTWSGTRPFRFMQAVVTNGGVVFGWACHRRDDANPHGRLHVIVLANDGHTLHEDMTRLRDSRSCDGPAEPFADGVLAVEEADCVLLRMHAESEDPKERDRSESWWRYRISTGEPLGHLLPRLRVPQVEDFSTTWGVVHVPGTPLLLAHWARASFDPEASGQRYVLSDVDGNPVWTVDMPGPFAFGEKRIDGRAHKHDWDGTGGILSVAPRRFELDLCAESKRVAYEVTQAADGTWSAREIGREPLFPEPEPEANRAAPAAPEPPKRLEPLGQIDLVAEDPPPPAVHGVGPFQIDDANQFVFARRVPLSRAYELVRVKPTGELASLVRLEPHRTDVGDWTGQMCWIHDDRAIVVWHTRPAGEELYELFEVSLADASTRALGVSIREHCHDIERTPDGGFVVLGGSQVLAFDASCKELWKRTAEDKVCGGGILTIDPSGRIVIQDQYGKDLHFQFLSAKGKVGAYEPIEDIGTDKPGYGAPLSLDPDGFWLLPFARGFLKIDGSNSCTGSWILRRPDGREIPPGRARVDREKRVWIAHDGSLVRLGEDGRFDRVLNESSDTVALREVEQLHVDASGRIHASSRKHGDVFVFDAHGKRTRVLRTEPADFPDGIGLYSVLDVEHDGSVTVGDGVVGTVRFDADGKRVRHEPVRQWFHRTLQPGTKAAWDVHGDAVRLVGADGTVLHATDTSPDDTPLQACGPGAVASDGTFAARARTGVRTELHEVVALFARDGTLSRLLPCDADMPSCFQWDGRRLVYLRAGVLHVRDVDSGAERAFAIDRGDWKPDGYSPVLTLVRDAKEAWVYDRWSTIYRYELP